MTTTISLSEDTKDRFDELRPEDVASADEFLGVLLDNYEGDGNNMGDELYGLLEGDADPVKPVRELREVGDSSAMLDEMGDKLDRIESAAQTAEERTGRIEQTVEDMEGRMR